MTANYPFPKQQTLDSSKLKEFADDNFKFDENGVNLYKMGENTVGKGEIARYEQFLLFMQCFQKACSADTYKPGLVWEGIKGYSLINTFDKFYNLSCSLLFVSCWEEV